MNALTYTGLAVAAAGSYYLMGKYGRQAWDRLTSGQGRRQ